MIIDSHTHNPKPDAVINIYPGYSPEPDLYYSCGIHPWNLDEATELTWNNLERYAALPNVVAIGETGLDRLKGPSLNKQKASFIHHAELAEKYHKPLIIHCVKAWPELLALHKQMKPTVAWIFHGFRLKPDVARRFIDAGFYLSFGKGYNPESVKVCPADRLLLETDEEPVPPSGINTLKGMTERALQDQLKRNNAFIFGVL